MATNNGEQCGDCQMVFAPEKLQIRTNPEHYGPVMTNKYINDNRCRFCWRDEKVNDTRPRQQCPCCQREYSPGEMKEKYAGYCGRCFESNAFKAKCDKCGNLDIGQTNICTKCRDASGETDKLFSEVTPLVLNKLYPDEPEKTYNVFGSGYGSKFSGWGLISARCPHEAYFKVNPNTLNNYIKGCIYREFRNGPINDNNETRVDNYLKEINGLLNISTFVKVAEVL